MLFLLRYGREYVSCVKNRKGVAGRFGRIREFSGRRDVMKRVSFWMMLLVSALHLSGCFVGFYEPPTKTVDVGATPVVDWKKTMSALLTANVNDKGEVNYDGVKLDEVKGVLAAMSKVKIDDTWSQNKRLAFWINAYNIGMIYNILSKWPLEKVSEFNDLFFKENKFAIAGLEVSLDDIENRIIRGKNPIAGVSLDKLYPQIHAAVSCAARSCPALWNQLWTEDNVIKTLDERFKKTLNDPQHAALKDGKPQLSRIFDWFYEDFAQDGKTVGEWLATYVDNADLKKALEAAAGDKNKLSFFEYDWTVNNFKK